MEKKSFILHTNMRSSVETLSNEDAGLLFKMIFAYEDGEPIPNNSVTQAFTFGFKPQLDENRKKYEAICERNKTNGQKGGRPPETQKEEKPKIERKPKTKDSDLLFERFWSVYPRKSAKAEARKAFSKITEQQLNETILPDLEKRKRSTQWMENDGSYIPYPATYLRGERWNDEIRTDKPKKIVRDFEERTVKDEDFSDLFLPL